MYWSLALTVHNIIVAEDGVNYCLKQASGCMVNLYQILYTHKLNILYTVNSMHACDVSLYNNWRKAGQRITYNLFMIGQHI